MFAQFSQARFSRDNLLLAAATGIFSLSFMGIQILSKTLYILRLGYGLEYLGLFGATGAISYMAMSLPSGAAGSYFGTRKAMFVGGIITIIGMAALPLVEFLPDRWHNTWPIITQALTSGGWSLFNINLVPALMGATTMQNRSSAYALNSMMRGFGSFTGAIVAGLLPTLFGALFGYSIEQPDPYRLSLWVAAVLGLFALIPLFLVRPTAQSAVTTQEQTAVGFPVLTITLLVFHVYFAQVGIAVCQTFCSAYMDSDLQLTPAIIGLIMGVGQFAAVLAPLFAPRLSARHGHAGLMTATNLASALSLLPLALLPHWSGVTIGGLGIMALSAMWMPALQVFQMELVEARWRSVAYGIVSMAMSLTFASTSLLGGRFAAQWGYQRLFLLAAGLSLIGVLVIWGMRRSPAVLGSRAQRSVS